MLNKKTKKLFVSGYLMGASDLVPGVSGGTMAFILGIYDELLYSIKAATSDFLISIIKFELREAFTIIPWSFLLPLGLGLITAILTLSRILESLLLNYPTHLRGLFFGLIVASILLVRKKVKKWYIKTYVLTFLAAVTAYFIVGLVPVETSNTPINIFISGVIAICAMVLPGISGSFLLLILGQYGNILNAVNRGDFLTLLFFIFGMTVGITFFARFISWTLKKHHDFTVAVLTGLMIGSLRKVWPWKVITQYRIDSHGQEVPFIDQNVFPAFDVSFLYVLTLLVFGYFLIKFIDRKISQ